MRVTVETLTHKEIGKGEFESRFNGIARSNLLQAAYYGDAKAKVENFKVRRFIINGTDGPAAIYQALLLKLPLLGTVARINRGPLFLGDDEKSAGPILRSLHDEWCDKNGCYIQLAPFLPDAESVSKMMSEVGFAKADGDKWHSGWLFLDRSEEELKKSLLQKWRNMLNKSHRMNLEIVELKGGTELDELLIEYEDFKRKIGFASVSGRLIRAMYEESPGDIIALTAKKEGKNVGSVIVARHGGSATYLTGFSSDPGRKANANYLLLWNAILKCRESGVKWFDVGGMDEEKTAGVTHFKKGLGLEQYFLAGEFSAGKGITSTAISVLKKLKG